MNRRGHTVCAVVAALAVLAFAGSASAATFSGVVVHKNARARSFVVAARGGSLRAVHARVMPRLARRVTVTARLLRNGTWALQRLRVGRHVARVRVRGTVTYVNKRRHVFVVSARGVSLLVHVRRTRGHHARAAADSQVAIGEIVTVDGSVDGDALDAANVQPSGHDVNGVELEGTVQAVDTTLRTVTVSADDSEESGSTLTVEVPASFDIGQFTQGESVELIVSPNPDGTYTLEQSSNDTGAQNANNQGGDQGDGTGDRHASAEQVCAAEQSDPNFAAAHNGESFAQFYNPQEPTNLGDAFGHCVDTKAQRQDGEDSGGDSGGSNSSTSTGSSSPGPGSSD